MEFKKIKGFFSKIYKRLGEEVRENLVYDVHTFKHFTYTYKEPIVAIT